MKWCEKCKVKIIGSKNYCPLCQNELIGRGQVDEDIFPTSYKGNKERHMIMKIVSFMMTLVGILSVFLNILFTTEIWWALIVVVTLICIRISLNIAMAKHKNILKYLLHQSLIIIVLALFIDYVTGGHGWAVTFVLPMIFTLAMILMYLLSKILHLQAGEYMIYLLLDALFGIIPIVFLVTNSVRTPIPSLVCIMISMISVTALIIFEGSAMYSELKRRLHINRGYEGSILSASTSYEYE